MLQELWISHKNTEDYDERAYQQMYDALSLRGREKIDATGSGQHRRQRILAYYLLERNGQDAAELYQPWATGGNGRRFSISHSGTLVYVAMSGQLVGIDVEEISRLKPERVERLSHSHFFTDKEKERLADASVEQFLKLWTFKEAMVKVTGIPLAKMLGTVDYFEVLKQAVREDDFYVWTWDGVPYKMKQWEEEGGIITVCQRPETQQVMSG